MGKKLIYVLVVALFSCGSPDSIVPPITHAADLNGYTSLYECRSGGPNCNVDVDTLAAQSCQQTITTATTPTNDWSAITWSNTVICIQTGDHTGRGTLTLGGSGTSGTRKILRCVTSGGAVCSHPVSVSSANRVIVERLEGGGNDFWIIDRLSFTESQTSEKLYFNTAEDDIIISRILAEGFEGSSEAALICDTCTDMTVQYSVIRSCGSAQFTSPAGIIYGRSTNFHAVNNEFYNCAKQIFNYQSGTNEPGAVVENNDLYVTSAYQTDCSGGVGTDCMLGEGMLSTKANGTSGSPQRFIHNRIWGARPCDSGEACDGGGAHGYLMNIGGGAATADFVLVQNNILSDGEAGIEINTQSTDGTDNISIVGNIIYKTQVYTASADLGGINFFAASSTHNAHEIYLNSFIRIKSGAAGGWIDFGGDTNLDIRCNAVIDSDATTDGPIGTGGQADFNAFYGTTEFTTESPDNDYGNVTLNTRANTTGYSTGDFMRTAATPTEDGGQADFIWIAESTGTSAGSPPTFCLRLNCVTIDGTVVWRAVRGPYKYFRKLITSPETVYVPYVRALATAKLPEHTALDSECTSGYASRTGIGIDNSADPGDPRLF